MTAGRRAVELPRARLSASEENEEEQKTNPHVATKAKPHAEFEYNRKS